MAENKIPMEKICIFPDEEDLKAFLSGIVSIENYRKAKIEEIQAELKVLCYNDEDYSKAIKALKGKDYLNYLYAYETLKHDLCRGLKMEDTFLISGKYCLLDDNVGGVGKSFGVLAEAFNHLKEEKTFDKPKSKFHK